VQGAAPDVQLPGNVTQAHPAAAETDGSVEIDPGRWAAQLDALGLGVVEPGPGSLDDPKPLLFCHSPEDGDQQGVS